MLPSLSPTHGVILPDVHGLHVSLLNLMRCPLDQISSLSRSLCSEALSCQSKYFSGINVSDCATIKDVDEDIDEDIEQRRSQY